MIILHRKVPLICDQCGLQYQNRNIFRDHWKTHERPWAFCDLCPKSFNRRDALIKHISAVHLKQRSLECKTCGFKSFCKNNLKKHIACHDPKTECKVCSKMVSNMKNHLRSHVKAKCSVCAKIISKTNFAIHMRMHKKR